MPWVLAFHLIAVIAWFAGLFYLPRLFVYHASCDDQVGKDRFKIMEHKLYYYIMTPAAVLASLLGLILLFSRWEWFLSKPWMLAKLALVGLLWIYHLYCGYLVGVFARDRNTFSHRFYRFFNEIPTLLLIVIIILAIVHP